MEQNKKKKIGRNILIIAFSILLIGMLFASGYLFNDIISQFKQANTQDDSLTVFNEVKEILEKNFYYGEDSEEYDEELIDQAITGMVESQNDPHTEYFSEEELQEFVNSLSSSFVGIGINYQETGKNILVTNVLEFSPAESAGLQAGDIIVGVDGNRCEDNDIDDILNMIKGVEGTDVIITVLRNNEEFDITITRASISNTVSSEIRDNIGVLTITQFADHTASEVKQHLEKIKMYNCDKLIIDLRDDTGGYAATLNAICRYFMDDGDVIMREFYRDGTEYVDEVTNSDKYEFDQIIILVNHYSASCSEVFALAMKENCNAIIVGEQTYGKGVAQVTKQLSNGGALKYTDVIWKSGNYVYIGDEGITPDYEVSLPEVLSKTYLILEEDEEYAYDCVNTDKVAEAQMMLEFLNYDIKRTDGYFDKATQTALTQYQKDIGLTVTGTLNYQTANSLNTSVINQWVNNKDIYDYQMNKALELCQ